MTFISDRLAKYESLLTAVDTAIEAVLSGQSYQFDDGQTRQQVTRADLGRLQKLQAYYEKKIQELSSGARKVTYGGGSW
jgi:hypothetical protein